MALMKHTAIVLAFAALASQAQPVTQTEAQMRAAYDESGFQYKFTSLASVATNSFGSIQTMTLAEVPSLSTLPGSGASQLVVTLTPCAIWNPHSHPRATEVLYVSGGSVKVGFQEENAGQNASGATVGGRLFNFSSVPIGTSVVLPQGLMHYIWNPNCKQATLFSSLDNRDPGTTSAAQALFNFPIDVVEAATGLDEARINLANSTVNQQPLVSFDSTCLATCGLSVSSTQNDTRSSLAPAPSAPAEATSTSGRRRRRLLDSSPLQQTEMQARAAYNVSDFQYKFNPAASLASNSYGSVETVFLNNLPSLNTLPGNGASQAVITLNPCTVWTPHLHPRASEINYVAQGYVEIGFREENLSKNISGQSYGGRLFNFSSIAQGSSIVVPQGLVHYMFNPTCEKTTILSSFDNKDPGVSSIAQALFKLPIEVISAATGLDAAAISLVQSLVVSQPLISFADECLHECGLSASVPAPAPAQGGY